jgi:hydroxymethylbilane synthase
MPLAAHATWQGDVLHVAVALGDGQDTARPLLRASAQGAVVDEAAARALGEQAAERLREQGATGYLAAL